MSWFKKLFQVFRREKDEYIDESNYQSSISNEGDSNNHRDVEAKILYKYPKGQFKFPLIPDEPIGEPRKEKELLRQTKTHSPPIEKTRKPQKRNKKTIAEKKENPLKTEQRKSNFSKRAFRPTEIPSPIYGYEPRPTKTEPIEFELKDFSTHSYKESGPPQDNLVAPTSLTESTQEQYVEEVEMELVSISEKDNWVDGNSHKEEDIVEVETDPYENLMIGDEEQSSKEEDIVEVEMVTLENLAVNKQFPIKEDIVRVETSALEDPKGEEHPLSFVDEGEIIVGVSEREEVSQYIDENEIESTRLNSVTDKGERRIERSHIPFNVIMLKEDKRKLSQRFTPTSIEEEASLPDCQMCHDEVAVTSEKDYPDLQEQEEELYYVLPSLDLLHPPVTQNVNDNWLYERETLLNETLQNFNVRAKVVNVTQGPSVTRFEVQPEPGVKVNKITNLADDIKLSLAAKDIRLEAPIPGKHTIGIEVPNKTSRPVLISEIIGSQEFLENPSPLGAVLGLDISGKPIVTDLKKMPHGLIAGATGSGKSVCINSILISLLYKADPSDVKLLLIDPKMVELAPYNQIPHLVSPVITDVKAATAALKWAVEEMEHRYELFAHTGVRDITRFNEVAEKEDRISDKLPYIVIVIDELADLMMMSPADVEEAICRIAQKARACGIHLIIATQRPSVDVITGLIKANVPTRIAFSVSSQVDSRTIIDISGAERLLGRGDMLFLENGSSKPIRLQGTFVSDEEIDAVVAHVRREQSPQYLFEQEELLKKAIVNDEEDELFYEACEFIIEQGGASTSSLQRRFKIGYNRAARLIDMMEEQGFISEARGSKPRDVLITETELGSIQDASTN